MIIVPSLPRAAFARNQAQTAAFAGARACVPMNPAEVTECDVCAGVYGLREWFEPQATEAGTGGGGGSGGSGEAGGGGSGGSGSGSGGKERGNQGGEVGGGGTGTGSRAANSTNAPHAAEGPGGPAGSAAAAAAASASPATQGAPARMSVRRCAARHVAGQRLSEGEISGNLLLSSIPLRGGRLAVSPLLGLLITAPFQAHPRRAPHPPRPRTAQRRHRRRLSRPRRRARPAMPGIRVGRGRQPSRLWLPRLRGAAGRMR